MTSPPGPEIRSRSFIKCDTETYQRIMHTLGESGPRAVVFWLACLMLANRARLNDVQPTLEKVNWPYLASVSGINERTLRRIRPALEREGIMFITATRHEVRIKILAGYWPNGTAVVDAPESPPADTPAPTGADDCPPRLQPAYDALKATGKLPRLTPAIVQRVAASHPKADFLERIEEVAERLAAVDGRISDPLAWLLKRAQEMEKAVKEKVVYPPVMGGECMS